jgi:acetyltransferase-like isoleucine patch superfamily enzyme
MRVQNIMKSISTVYKRTTMVEGTVHLLKGAFKTLQVLLISSYWRFNFNRTGKNLSIYPGVKIHFPKNISVGNNVLINCASYLKSENTKARVIIGDNVNIGEHVLIDCSGNVKIEQNVLISSRSVIHTHCHGTNRA